MKIIYVYMGLFSFFLLSCTYAHALKESNIRRTIHNIMHEPVKTTLNIAKVGAKGCIAGYACFLAYCRVKNRFTYDFNDGNFSVCFGKNPMKNIFMCGGLCLIVYEAGKSLLEDVEKFK